MNSIVWIVIGILALITMIVPFLNNIMCIVFNVARIVLISLLVKQNADIAIVMTISTAVLTLYGFGASAFDDTRHETGNILINPIEGGGYKICSEVVGDAPMQTFVSAVIYSGIIGVVSFFLYGILCGILEAKFGTNGFVVFCIALSIIGILRGVITLIQSIKNN